MRAQEATLKEGANSKLQRLLAHNKTFNCAEIDAGDIVLFFKAQNRKNLPRRRGPAKVLGIHQMASLYRVQVKPSKLLATVYTVA